MSWSPILPLDRHRHKHAVSVSIGPDQGKARSLFVILRPEVLDERLGWWAAGTQVAAAFGTDEHEGWLRVCVARNGQFVLKRGMGHRNKGERKSPEAPMLLLPAPRWIDGAGHRDGNPQFVVGETSIEIELPEWARQPASAVPVLAAEKPARWREPPPAPPPVPRDTVADVAREPVPAEPEPAPPAAMLPPAPVPAPVPTPRPATGLTGLRVWTEERCLLLQSDYPRGVPIRDLLAALDRLPGPPIKDGNNIAAQAGKLGLKRPTSAPAASALPAPLVKQGVESAPESKVRPPQAAVRADRETIVRWGAERGLPPYSLDLAAVNRKRAQLGLLPFELDAPARSRVGA